MDEKFFKQVASKLYILVITGILASLVPVRKKKAKPKRPKIFADEEDNFHL